MFKISEIHELCCDAREVSKAYEEFEREHNTRELGHKLRRYAEKYGVRVNDLIGIPEVIKDLGEDYQEQLNIGIREITNRCALEEIHCECLGKLFDLEELFMDLAPQIKTSVVEELFAATYMLWSSYDYVVSTLYSTPNRIKSLYDDSCNYLDNLEELLKKVSPKSLEEVVQEYCSNW